jgi:hypothetical protein
MDNPNNVINLAAWLKTNDIYNLKALDHAFKLKKIAEADSLRSISFEQYQAEVNASLNLIPLNQKEGT